MMGKIKFDDFKIIPDFRSIYKKDISDEEYFSNKYSNFISNSRLKYIDPKDNGSPQLFLNPPKIKTQSLNIGSAVHQLILQPNEFELAPKINKPTAKLGMVMDEIEKLIKDKKRVNLDSIIRQAATNVDYYAKTIDNKIDYIKEVWNNYYSNLKHIRDIKTKDQQIVVSDNEWDIIDACVKSIQDNPDIISKLFPKDIFGECIESHFEEAFFIDFIVIYKGKQCSTIKFKLKIDNWTIDYDNKLVTLNDLKTSGHFLKSFMEEDGSFYKYSYYRQMYVYGLILYYYLMKNNGVCRQQGWNLDTNMLVVQTIPDYWSRSFFVSDAQLKEGKQNFEELLKRVAYYEIFGYDKEVEFI